MRMLLTLILGVGGLAWGAGPESLHGLGDTRYHVVESSATDRNYDVVVGLPRDYGTEPDARFPTIYLLDGGTLYPMLSAYRRYLRHANEIPGFILVAISYGTDDWREGNDRSHDYTAAASDREHWGGAADFQRFLGTELIPLIEEQYRADPARRVLFGHSLGGQFVLHAAQTEPSLFWGYMASNPALHRNLAFYLSTRPAPPNHQPRLFVATAEHDEARFRTPAERWVRHWSSLDDAPWDLHAITIPGHNHFSSVPAAFRAGIAWLFAHPPQN